MAHCKEFQTFDLFVDNDEEKKKIQYFPRTIFAQSFSKPKFSFLFESLPLPFFVLIIFLLLIFFEQNAVLQFFVGCFSVLLLSS